MYSALTDTIEVRVVPSYLRERSAPESNVWFWAYTVEIVNLGQSPVQLMARHWEITDGTGKVQHVRGEGVVGKQPVIEPGECFQYSSGCPLKTESGIMAGEYEMKDAKGRPFVVKIPAFSLDSPGTGRTLN
jgi:ApaG protein